MIKNLYYVLSDLKKFNLLKNDFIYSKNKIFEYKNIRIEKYYNKYTVFIKNINIKDTLNSSLQNTNIYIPNNCKWLVMNKSELACFLNNYNNENMPCLYDLIRFITIINTDLCIKNKYLLIYPLYYGHGGFNHVQVSPSYEYDKNIKILHKNHGYDLKIDNNKHIQLIKDFINN